MPSILPSWYELIGPRERKPARDTDFQDTEPNAEVPPLEETEAWRHSSHELERGLDVDEVPIDTLPGDLVDGLLPPRRRPA